MDVEHDPYCDGNHRGRQRCNAALALPDETDSTFEPGAAHAGAALVPELSQPVEHQSIRGRHAAGEQAAPVPPAVRAPATGRPRRASVGWWLVAPAVAAAASMFVGSRVVRRRRRA